MRWLKSVAALVSLLALYLLNKLHISAGADASLSQTKQVNIACETFLRERCNCTEIYSSRGSLYPAKRCSSRKKVVAFSLFGTLDNENYKYFSLLRVNAAFVKENLPGNLGTFEIALL